MLHIPPHTCNAEKPFFLFYIAFPPQYSPIRIRTEVSGFKVPSDNHYTIGEKWSRWESNPEPFPCKGNVITVTLRNQKHKYLYVLLGGLEPPTFA